MLVVEERKKSTRNDSTKDTSMVLLKDRRIARIRRMRKDDIASIAEMHTRLSADSLYDRYLHPYKPTIEDIQKIYQISQAGGAAFVATLWGNPEKVIGVAHYGITKSRPGETEPATEPAAETAAEPAVIVEDQFQGLGLGRALLEHMAYSARANGIKVLKAVIHPANSRIMHLVTSGGLPYRKKYLQGVWGISVQV
jgi:L-amino acid N-acyltransferase YncA